MKTSFMLSSLHWFVISFVIGLLIGIERERRHPAGTQAIGVRTFTLLALLGTFVAVINNATLTLTISAFVLVAILLGYHRSTQLIGSENGIGLTTEISAAIVFCLGFITPQQPLLAAVLACGVVLVLIERKRLHTFSRDILTRQEIESAVVLLIFIVGVIPFLPQEPVDPWGLVNLQYLGTLMAMIGAIQYIGYVMIRVFGNRLGMTLTGFFGGLVSSTAVFLSLPQMIKKQPGLMRSASSAALLAVTGKITQLVVLLFVASLSLFYILLPPLLLMILVAMVIVACLMYIDTKKVKIKKLTNPLDIKSVLQLTLFIGGMFTLVALLRRYVGVEGVHLVSFLGAMFELHGSALAIALLFASGKLQITEASTAIGIAVLGSFVSKFVLLWSLTWNRYAVITSLGLAAMLVPGILVFLLVGL